MAKRLTAALCRTANEPGKYRGENGLFLLVKRSKSGKVTKSWVQRLTVYGGKRNGVRLIGQRRELGMGPFPLVSLAEANREALENRKLARTGVDPIKARERKAVTFIDALEAVLKINSPNWKNSGKTAAHWRATMEHHAKPLHNLSVDAITTADVMACLSPIWNTKRETARKVRQRLRTIFNWAIAEGFRADNPAGEQINAALPKTGRTKTHQKALPFSEVAQAVATIRATDAHISTRLAFEFLVLTAARSGEVRFATWGEIDTDAATWTVPAERMKTEREHRVPLSPRALEVLNEARQHTDDSGLIFPSATGRAMSDSTLSKLCREQSIGAVPHGFRTSFRVWGAEKTNYPREVLEAALSHVLHNQSEAAYARTDHFAKRRAVMELWAEYLSGARSNVVALRA